MGLPCQASNALRGKSFTEKCKNQSRKELKINSEMMIKREASITQADVASIIPTDLKATNNGNQVRDRILQKSATAFFNSSMIKNTFLMKTAKSVENTTKMDIAIKKDVRNPAVQETEHKFNFDIQALKGEAKISYKGFIDSKIEYKAGSDTFLVSVEEQLSSNSKIALSHTKDREQSRQLLQYQLSW